uniref:Uncharacterized protein n=1 Tax=Panagrolaimus sp. ES5 TaxID=591445 RepID=A0AC34FNM0_9BILA
MNDFGIIVSKLEVFGEEYSKEIKCLLSKLQKTKDRREHCFYIKAFAKKYTLLPKLWEYWNISESRLTTSTSTENESMKYKHFCCPSYQERCPLTTKVADVDKHFYTYYSLDTYQTETTLQSFVRIKALKEGIFFPHQDMEKLYEKYDRNSSYALSPKEVVQYKEALKMYTKMKEVEKDSEKWLECLQEVPDPEYLINSCEVRLMKNPYDAGFWDSYLNYLKPVDTKMLLKTYSRYCRLFLFNYYLRDEYFDAIFAATISDKLVWWIDYISLIRMLNSVYETIEKMTQILIQCYSMPGNWNFKNDNYDSNLQTFIDIINTAENMISVPMETNEEQSIKTLRHPTTSKTSIPKRLTPAINQRFLFKATIMRYILDRASPQLLQKLHMSCKELYLQKSTVYCQRLCIKTGPAFGKNSIIQPTFFENAVVVSPQNLHQTDFTNYHLVNSLEIVDVFGFRDLLPDIQKCSIRYLTLQNQSINEYDMEFFTSNVEFLEFFKVTVSKADGTVAPVEYIIEKLSHVPNIKLFDIPKTSFNIGSAQNLAALQRNVLMKTFYLNNLPEDFKVDHFCKFIEANAEENAELKFGFDVVDRLLKFELGQRLRTKLRKLAKEFKLL